MKLTSGDVNAEGEVDCADAVYLAGFAADWSEYANINTADSNVDNNGDVNIIYSVILARHIAAWSGYQSLTLN